MIRNRFGTNFVRAAAFIVVIVAFVGCGTSEEAREPSRPEPEVEAGEQVSSRPRPRFDKPRIRDGELAYRDEEPAITSISEFLAMYTDEELEDVRVLDLMGNEISVVDGLERLPNLTDIYLVHNQIESLNDVFFPPGLSGIGLNWNQLSSIEDIPSHPNLQGLDLSNNKIESTKGLNRFPALTYIALAGNPIREFDELLERTGLRYVTFGVAEGVRSEEAFEIAQTIRDNNPEIEIYW